MAEKKYYWLKMTDQFFEDKAIKKLRKIAGGDTYTIIYLKMLLTAIKQGNKMYFEGIEDDFMEELALELDEDTDNVKVILEGHEISAEAVRMLKSVMRKVEGLDGEKVTVTLTNSQVYPFNNSVKTIQLKTPRNYKTYLITAEVTSVSGGAVGDIEFTDKLLNGFKVAYTGSAKSVTMDLYVRGGM